MATNPMGARELNKMLFSSTMVVEQLSYPCFVMRRVGFLSQGSSSLLSVTGETQGISPSQNDSSLERALNRSQFQKVTYVHGRMVAVIDSNIAEHLEKNGPHDQIRMA